MRHARRTGVSGARAAGGRPTREVAAPHSGSRLPNIDRPKGKGFQYVPDGITYARAHHQLFTKPRAGDIFLCKDGHHTGIVDRVFPDGHFTTIEGNAGPGSSMVYHGSRGGSGDQTYYFWTAIRP